ncbi:metal ABC transporter substrate-binding protein [Jeotgalibaca sp. MA1X17-3]|uniref:metal ABC transporter substrate-binding protein n=1 Tax=Jeotgalibaca sp. MA1X17-3 TaxID=2908211 RepID=UPI001F30A382|nr:metal ABC transporter substrate-binding protein [Jeotgalibaca sp. MA1X17-3]UJF16570.1 metal ABC transporter substrate-binding protein [Jeotgalibaca sp. MA1X17-3]
MKKITKGLLGLILTIGLAACGNGGTDTDSSGEVGDNSDKIGVVATNSILADMIYNITGDAVDLHSIVPVGTDPHEFEPLPVDIAKSTDADIVFYNGLNLETGGNGWFVKLMESSKKVEGEDYFVASTGVEPFYLTTTGETTNQDPHAWLDIQNGITYVKNMTEVLIEKDSKNKELYTKNSEDYIEKLEELDARAKSQFNDLPEEKKLLVTSEGAFKYFSHAYGLEGAFIWEINTENQGTPEQMTQIIDKINATEVPVLFVETSVDPRTMERVSKETGIEIYSKIFTDSVAKKGEPGDSYYDMLEWNLEKIHEGLETDRK